MARRRWYRGLAPVSLVVPCQGQAHRILWRAGRLVVADHDVPAESALIALGATPCPCLAVLSAWRDLHRQAQLGPLWNLDAVFGVRPTWRVAAARSTTTGLPAALHPVAVLAAVVRAERRWADPTLPDDDRRRLRHFLASRVRDAVEESLVLPRLSRPNADVVVACEVATRGESVAVEATGAGHRHHLRIRLPLSWLVEIWARNLSRVEELVVLEATPDPNGDCLETLALRFELRGLYGLDPGLVYVRLRHHPRHGWRADPHDATHPEPYGLVGS